MENILKIAYYVTIGLIVITLIVFLVHKRKLKKTLNKLKEPLEDIDKKKDDFKKQKEYINSVSKKNHLSEILLGLAFYSNLKKNIKKEDSFKTALNKTVKKEVTSQIKRHI